jgi:hypothetical protein
VSQGSIPAANPVFRCTFVPPDFPGLTGRDLTPGQPIEQNPTYPSICDTVSTGVETITEKPQLSVFPNPAHNYLNVTISPFDDNLVLTVFNFEGKLLFKSKIRSPKFTIDLSGYTKGIYLLRVKHGEEVFSSKFIKE